MEGIRPPSSTETLMKNQTVPRVLLALVASSLQAGCLSKNPMPPTRYFEPVSVASANSAAWNGAPIRQITASAPAHLRDRMAWRVSAVEMAFDESNLWVANPAAMVEQALRSAVQERGGLSPNERGSVLEVTVEAFEGQLDSPRTARIDLHVSCYADDSNTVELRSFRAEADLSGKGPEDLARGIGIALERAAGDVLDWVAGLEGRSRSPSKTR